MVLQFFCVSMAGVAAVVLALAAELGPLSVSAASFVYFLGFFGLLADIFVPDIDAAAWRDTA